MKSIYFVLIGYLFIVLLSCEKPLKEKYPPLGWSKSKIDSLRSVISETRDEELHSFELYRKVHLSCKFQNSNIEGLINLDSTDNITDTSSAELYKLKMCNLIKESRAILIFADSSLGNFICFKFPDEVEIYYFPDSPLIKHSGWGNIHKVELKYDENWFYNPNGKQFKLPG